ncbi:MULTISPECIES: DUF4148 domain-containing protein [unclassified Simplicispira]|jgi:hypothetical protein|uniref:DUF4148 domain-containing protein n=1 Tax=unclassified Simplicispira TaxID=2630407 RepID=UPI000D5DCF37|nr:MULTISPECIES: DUF4148 domain-containing protein [unclassified Simplicispira]MBH1978425.1 DUF4148 domain-containing protein [Comamonadaceae bacterium]PVY58237.1 hypothetical protein C8D04_3551 [Simplicispira sp. 125]REG15602.1 hypothetical protein C8D01_0133 [Simplicispira sp. 110]
MNTARILSIAAVAAFASIGAQAVELNGNLYGTNFEANFQSTRSSADVRAEGVKALPSFKNFAVATPAASSALDRATVRAEAVTAARAGQIAIGNRS